MIPAVVWGLKLLNGLQFRSAPGQRAEPTLGQSQSATLAGVGRFIRWFVIANFDSALDSSGNNYRTWYVSHFHGLYGDADKQYVRDVLAYVKTKEADVWVGTFTEVAKYGQEYATAALSNIQVGAASVQFELKDAMNDVWFDEPLTVKLRLPDGWSGSVGATQNGAAIPVRVVQHDGQAYALVDAVPDGGLVVVGF